MLDVDVEWDFVGLVQGKLKKINFHWKCEILDYRYTGSMIVWGKIDFKFACKIKYEFYEMTIYPCADLNA